MALSTHTYPNLSDKTSFDAIFTYNVYQDMIRDDALCSYLREFVQNVKNFFSSDEKLLDDAKLSRFSDDGEQKMVHVNAKIFHLIVEKIKSKLSKQQ